MSRFTAFLIALAMALRAWLRRVRAALPGARRRDEAALLRDELAELRAELRALSTRLPPAGWTCSNYHLEGDPRYSMSVNTQSRRWSVFMGHQFVCEASSPDEAAALLRNVRAP